MKRTVIASLGFAAVFAAVTAVGKPERVLDQEGVVKDLTAGITHSAFFGLSLGAERSIAVGLGGAIAESDDGGKTWKPVEQTETELALLSVDRAGSHTVAVGQMGLVMYEASPGQWKKADSGIEGRLLSVSVNSSGLGVAGGEFGTLLMTEDGGRSWRSAPPDWTLYEDKETFGTAEPHVYAVEVEEDGTITIAGEFGVILRSRDRGQSWRVLKQLKAGEPTIFAMHIAQPGAGNSFAVGQEGEILTSADGGTTWMRCSTRTKAPFLGVTAKPNGEAVVTGMRIMMRSANGGVTWESIEEGDTITDWYQTVKTHPATGAFIAVGHSGKVIQIGG